jgi:hypothetical protein
MFGIVVLLLLLGGGASWAQYSNTAYGTDALAHDSTGVDNSAFGFGVLFNNTTGSYNTATGYGALEKNVAGGDNTANGYEALFSNTTGVYNSATGTGALFGNTTGSGNVASGSEALFANTGSYNTASGYEALFTNTANYNTANGASALYSNTTGGANTASGASALSKNTTGVGNTACGYEAGRTNTSGTYNTFIGESADANAGTYTNGTALGAGALLTASDSIVLGNGSITKIYAKVTTITAISDRRRKKDVAALGSDLGLDFVEKLQPVSYRFNDGDETQRYGFIAQDLEQALPASLRDAIEQSQPEHGLALLERANDKDRTYRVSYGELFAPIVKSIQEQQREIMAQRQENAALRHALVDQAAAFKAALADQAELRHSIEALTEQVRAAHERDARVATGAVSDAP